MKRMLIATAAPLLVTAVQADAKTRCVVRRAANSGVTVYDHDSPDPNIGWHTASTGMCVCHQDCDNPEIPGSSARCHNVSFMAMPMRECVTGTPLFGGGHSNNGGHCCAREGGVSVRRGVDTSSYAASFGEASSA